VAERSEENRGRGSGVRGGGTAGDGGGGDTRAIERATTKATGKAKRAATSRSTSSRSTHNKSTRPVSPRFHMDAIKGRHCGYAGQLLVGGINSDYVAEATAVMMDGGPCPGMHVRPVAQRRWVTFEPRNVIYGPYSRSRTLCMPLCAGVCAREIGSRKHL
jgi:hypothetical protein